MTTLKLPNGLPEAPKKVSSKLDLKNMEKSIKDAIDTVVVKENYRAPYGLNKIGAGEIGEECSRKIWYKFRKVLVTSFNAKTLRLFGTGHIIEDRVIKWLEKSGWTVVYQDENGKQYKCKPVAGHFTGKLDLILTNEKLYPGVVIMADVKSFNDANFKKWKKDGVRVSHNKYFCQVSIYAVDYGVPYGAIIGVNKNTDDLDVEIFEVDTDYVSSLKAKAERIITTKIAPAQIAMSEAHFKCKFCDYKKLCHLGEGVIDINCRSCVNGTAQEDGSWSCDIYGAIPSDAIIKGCRQHNPIA